MAWFAMALLVGVQEEMGVPKPGPEHELLKSFEGTWDVVGRFCMEPEKPPAESKGTYVAKMRCGGFWLVGDYKGEMMNTQFEGHGVLGYDTRKKKFVSSWVDSMSTHFGTDEGTYDEKSKSFTFVGEAPNAAGKMEKYRQVWWVKGQDRFDIVFYSIGEGDKETKTGEMEFRRKKEK